ncbi:MAG: methyltransferase domain-containing protein [Pseudomonadota bacterium]
MLVPFQRKILPLTDVDKDEALSAWFDSECGVTLRREVVAAVERILPDLFGYHLVTVGAHAGRELIASSRISHQITIGAKADGDDGIDLVSNHHALPVAENAIDVLVLPFVLEFSDDPHQLLREAERVLIGEGHILIVSFNPWSLFGLWRLFLGWRDGVPWRGRFMPQSRIKDWLQLLGFDVRHASKIGFRPPLQRPGVNRRFEFMEQLGAFAWPIFGNASVLVAKKRVASVTPLKASWETRRRLLAGGGVVEPTTRNNRNSDKPL